MFVCLFLILITFIADAVDNPTAMNRTSRTRLQSDDSDEDAYQFMYSSPNLFHQGKSTSFSNVEAKNSVPGRRQTYNDYSIPELEDSADDLEPYVRMDTFLPNKGVDLRASAKKANLRVKAKKKVNRMKSIIREVSEDEYVYQEEFLGNFKKVDGARSEEPICTISFVT